MPNFIKLFREKRTFIFLLILIPSLGANFAFIGFLFQLPKFINSSKDITNKTDNEFLSPLIQTENPNDVLINFTLLRNNLNRYVENVNADLGLFFEYLPSGITIGINEKETFYQASLVKVPMAMYLYKGIELGKITMKDLYVIEDKYKDSDFGELWKKPSGTTISLEELINIMLVDSDNTAYRTLWGKYPQFLDEIFDNLDLPKDSEKGDPVVTPKNYSSVFKSLYLSSYNTKEHSNEILETLTTTSFDNWIVAGVDNNIKVAHKIGVRDKEHAYSDCGIVYIPDRPYFLCVFVGGSIEDADTHIPALSREIFQFVKNEQKN